MLTAFATTMTREAFDDGPARAKLDLLLWLSALSALYVLATAFLIKLLWNSVLVAAVPGVKPLASVWQAVLIKVLLTLLVN